jgi:hypothetical protein
MSSTDLSDFRSNEIAPSRRLVFVLRLRPPRHARPLPGVRDASQATTRGRSGRVRRRLSTSRRRRRWCCVWRPPPPFNFRRSGSSPAKDSPAVTRTSDGTGPLRPSRRENQPDTPPTQQEIQAFLHRLRRTSFKRGSKGFKTWMKGFGIDSDASGDDENQPH